MIAIGLLLIYHVAIGFQPWGVMIGFIANTQPWESLWIPMAMLNVWRIPLLFFVSGMGVYFALNNRNWTQLLQERATRILLPYVFGMFLIVPLHTYIWQNHYHLPLTYTHSPGHLWFLGNIFVYVLVLSPLFFYLRRHEEGKLARGIRAVLTNTLGLLLVVGAFILEAMILNPRPYEMYAMTWHGFYLGFLAFFFGFCFVLSGTSFWELIVKGRWILPLSAILLFIIRITQFKMNVPFYLLVPESLCWILSVFAFGYSYLNRPGKTLSYLSEAAYPVYILHMVFLYLGSWLIFPLEMAVQVKFVLVLLFTGVGCFATFELIKRINLMRPLFGLKMRR